MGDFKQSSVVEVRWLWTSIILVRSGYHQHKLVQEQSTSDCPFPWYDADGVERRLTGGTVGKNWELLGASPF